MPELPRGERDNGPVFLDKRGRRAICTNLVLAMTALCAAVGTAVVVLGLIVAPALPALPVATLDPRPSLSGSHIAIKATSSIPVSGVSNRHVPQEAINALRFAFFDHADIGSLASLQHHAALLDAIIPDWLEITRAERGVKLSVDRNSRAVANWLRQNAPHIKIYPELSTRLGTGEVAAMLASSAGRRLLIENTARYLNDNDFNGVTVNMRSLPPSTHRNLVTFLEEIGSALRSGGRELIFILPQNEPAQRTQALSRPCDYVLLKLYDDSSAEQAPIASQGWFESRLKSQSSGLERAKLIIAVASFGYDWDEWGGKREISVQAAWDLASRSNTKLVFDEVSLNPSFLYPDDNGTRHYIWYLDAVTAFNQLRAVLAIQPAGIAIWRLGLEDRGVWASAGRSRLPDDKALAAIARMEPGFDSFARARAAALDAKPGHTGERRISYNKSLGLAVEQTILKLPRQVVLTEWHAVAPKTVAFTFDDGPNPVYTPKILDILAQNSVKATFYVLGAHALAYPDLLQRIYDDGHDLGNHSWSHAEMHEGSSTARIRSELNGTQRVLEGKLQIRSILFRPPYTAGSYLRLDNAVDMVRTVSELGYVFAGFDGNSFDYLLSPDQIIAETLTQVEGGARVVLFHDSGGNRQRTVDALPVIIDQLKARGFRLVSTHELIGMARHEVMPPVAHDLITDRAEAFIRVESAGLLLWLAAAIPAVAIVAAILGIVRIVLIVIAALVQTRRKSSSRDTWRPGKIAILVPAYNEEDVISKTLSALLSSTYSGLLDIIVIDDGSSDQTSEVVRQAFGDNPKITIIRKENGGKASALNCGIERTDAEIIVAIDGDTILMSDAIEHLVKHFQDPTVGAVAGNVIVGNQKTLITRFQALEYITSQSLDRRAFELFNAIGVVPGAIGAWRRRALVEVQGYSSATLAEDADLTFAIERRNWRVVSEPQARALTEAPETVRAFMKQRFRWMFGTLQVAWKHISLHGPGRGVVLIAIPNVFLFQFGFTLLAPVMDLLLVFAGIAALAGSNDETLLLLLGYWVFFQLVDATAAAVGIALSHDRANWRLLPLILLQRISYRQLLYVVAIRALLAAVKGRLVGWGKLVRTGSVVWQPRGSNVMQTETRKS